jgi:8-oxo-dGTP pyrophosphatase MutT (NUDIX family)
MEVVRQFISTVYVLKEDKVLLTWNKVVKIWVPVGGHIDENELPCNSVIREAKEESGLDIELFNPYQDKESSNLPQPVHMHLDHIRDDHEHINLIYFGRVIGGELLDESDEQTPIRFFNHDELEALELVPNIKEWAIEILKWGK